MQAQRTTDIMQAEHQQLVIILIIDTFRNYIVAEQTQTTYIDLVVGTNREIFLRIKYVKRIHKQTSWDCVNDQSSF